MRNAYAIRGDITAIILRRRDGTASETLVDTADLDRLLAADVRWSYAKKRDRYSAYACTYIRRGKGSYSRLDLHRFLMSLPEGAEVDHANRDGLDNRRSNLRLATSSLNHANCRQRGTLYRGVRYKRPNRKWVASITYQGKKQHLGYFATAEEAAIAYNQAAASTFGEFACLNDVVTSQPD